MLNWKIALDILERIQDRAREEIHRKEDRNVFEILGAIMRQELLDRIKAVSTLLGELVEVLAIPKAKRDRLRFKLGQVIEAFELAVAHMQAEVRHLNTVNVELRERSDHLRQELEKAQDELRRTHTTLGAVREVLRGANTPFATGLGTLLDQARPR